ncbi:hypothetical protein [Kitasatospora sp. NPDC090308]|uniref:hypothetical protein n=1 Tax=Kitasatospora sp. NPDC090308 TaxID=3364082 RepID=UPI0038004DE5
MAVTETETRTQDVFDTARTWVTLFGAIGAVVLGTVAVLALAGQPTTPFLWVRGALLFLSEGSVSKYTTTIFAKLGLANDDDTNRRVRAVLAYLSADRGAG